MGALAGPDVAGQMSAALAGPHTQQLVIRAKGHYGTGGPPGTTLRELAPSLEVNRAFVGRRSRAGASWKAAAHLCPVSWPRRFRPPQHRPMVPQSTVDLHSQQGGQGQFRQQVESHQRKQMLRVQNIKPRCRRMPWAAPTLPSLPPPPQPLLFARRCLRAECVLRRRERPDICCSTRKAARLYHPHRRMRVVATAPAAATLLALSPPGKLETVTATGGALQYALRIWTWQRGSAEQQATGV